MNNPQNYNSDGKLPEEVQKGGSDFSENMETASERYNGPSSEKTTIKSPLEKQVSGHDEKPVKSLWDEVNQP